MGSGASPWRPYMAWRRSACSVLVGRPVEVRPLHVDDDEGQFEVDGQADGLGLEIEAGAAGGGHAERPAEGRAEAAPTPAISSSAWKVRMPNSLRRLSSWRMSEAG